MVEKAKFLLFDIDYILENGEPVVRLWCKNSDGVSLLIDRHFKPYFYIEPAYENGFDLKEFREKIYVLQDIGKKVKKIEMVEKKLLGEERQFVKIVLHEPGDVNVLRKLIENWKEVKKAYEHDIMFYRRYLIDKDLIPMQWIEVEAEERGKKDAHEIKSFEISNVRICDDYTTEKTKLKVIAVDIEVYGDEIIMVSVVGENYKKVLTYGWDDQQSNEKIEILEDEKQMILRLVSIIKEINPDIIVTYNGDLFDFAKLQERAHYHKIHFSIGREDQEIKFVKRAREFSAWIPGRMHIDLYPFVSHILSDVMESETLTLDMVSKEMLGFGKEPLDWKKIEEIWKERKDLKTIADYCLRDSELTFQLAERFLPQIFEIAKLIGQTPFDVSRMTYSQLVEWLLIRRAYKKNEIVLNRPTHDEIKRRREAEPYTGGYVLPPKPGMHENIAIFDFASLYPSTIITHNISPETLDKNGEGKEKNIVPDSEHFFSAEKKGFIPEIIEELIKRRFEIKKQMKKLDQNSSKYRDLYNRQYALKIIANASYGYYAYPGSRWYSRVCAMSIASFGRFYIQKVINFAKEKGLEVIYGDTDSLFIANCDKETAKKFMKEVNKMLPGSMELDLEGIYKAGIFVFAKTGTSAKKRYALLDENGNIKIRGFEKVRRDWCKIAKETQEKVLLAILKEKNLRKAIETVKEVIEKIKKGDVDS
ncbi:MAG: DNA-directed DNA polymerase, partial [Candidatus Aenigmatarchaeota archaeon]